MTHASLFSGIGGFDLAAEWAGWTNIFNCEIDPFCRRVLQYHFPNAKQYTDIRATDFTVWRGRIDVLTGGFPCQPFSVAGKRKGTDDPRHLWPEMLRAIREIRPRWVVGENVRGILSWSGGMVFEQVCADLEAAGYEVQPFVLPACGVGAPHRRDRVWFVAHAVSSRTGHESREIGNQVRGTGENRSENIRQVHRAVSTDRVKSAGNDVADSADAGSKTVRERADGVLPHVPSADPDGTRWKKHHASEEPSEPMRRGRKRGDLAIPAWDGFPTQSPVCSGDDGLPAGLDGITVPRWRAESIKAYGNAIVPQVAYKIFRTINETEK